MNTLTIKLKQHTPLIHFQHDQYGATLRASEVKPKLDKFIISNYIGSIPKCWKVGKTDALDFKIRIVTENDCAIQEKLPMYFGGIKGSRLASDISLEIFCLYEDLIKYIDENVDWDDFFLTNNFGTRQGKGYGSFSRFYNVGAPKNSTGGEDSNILNFIGKKIKSSNDKVWRVDSCFIVDNTKSSDWLSVMNRIDNVYRCMRGGINNRGLYFKSLMFSFAKSEKFYWDKRMIKELFYPIILNDQLKGNDPKSALLQKWTSFASKGKRTIYLNAHPKSDALLTSDSIKAEKYLFRDYLGLSTEEMWKIPFNKKITKRSNDVARFASPIMFKPIWHKDIWYVFLLHHEIPNSFTSKSFVVEGRTLKKKDGQDDRFAPYYNEYGTKKEKQIMMTYPEFTMTKYLNYIFNRDIKYEEHFNNPNRDDAKIILNDLNCLRKNFKSIEINSL